MTFLLSRRVFVAGSMSLIAAPALAHHDVKAGDLTIVHPWSRATPEGARVAGGYMTIRNAGAQADRLTGGTFAEAGRVEIHEMAMANGVMTMRELAAGLEIPAGGSVELKPGGLHVMFMDLKRALKKDEMIAGTLTFARAGTVNVTWAIGALGQGASGGQHQHQGHTPPRS
jgi:copper(I)-binding protein